MKLLNTFAFLGLSASALSGAAVSVFFDNGSIAPGSTNTSVPFSNNTREQTWDIPVAQQGGLAAVGGAVMEVRMISLNVNGDSRRMTTAGGNGFGVETGGNNNWLDGNTQEGAVFEFKIFSDAAKTTEVTGLTYTLTSTLVRSTNESRHTLDAYSGNGELTFVDVGSPVTSPSSNNTDIFLGGTLLNGASDNANQLTQDLGIVPPGLTPGGPAGAPVFRTATSSGVTFDEDDVFWVRRRNGAGAPNAAYQVGAFTFDVIPEPSSALLISLGSLLCL